MRHLVELQPTRAELTLAIVAGHRAPRPIRPSTAVRVAGVHERIQVLADLVTYRLGEVTSAMGLSIVRSLTWSTAPLEGVPRIDARHLPASS
jgi:hypothetical protein